MLQLKKPTMEMKEKIIAYNNAWVDRGEKLIPYAARLHNKSFEEWLKDTMELENGAEEPFVTQEVWFLFQDDRIVGACTLRHSLNAYLMSVGGHIGYGVHPEERRKGYGFHMLSEILTHAKTRALIKVLVTCNVGNKASEKTILKCGGLLENIIDDGENQVARYWFTL